MLDLPKCRCLKLESKSKKKPSFGQHWNQSTNAWKNENLEDLDLEAHNVRSGAKPRMYSRNVCLKNKTLSHDFYPHLFSLYISFSGVLATPQVQGNLEVKWLVPPSCDYLSTLFFWGARTCSFVKNWVCTKPRPERDQCTFCFMPLLVFNLCVRVVFVCFLQRLLSFVFSQLCSMESSNFGAGSIHLFDVTNLQLMLSKAMIKNVIRSEIFQCWKTKQLHTSEDNCKVSLCPAWGSPPSCFSMSSTRVLIASLISMVRSSREQSQSVDD